MTKFHRALLLMFGISIIFSAQSQSIDGIRVKYNQPGLTTDLGTGLWGTPIPVDYDGDGRMDLLMSVRDVPYRGIYFFKNIGTKDSAFFDKAIQLSNQAYPNTQASYANDSLFVFVAGGQELLDFKKKLLSQPRQIKPDIVPGHDFKKIRSNMWSYVDYDGDGDRDILVGIDDWGDYGWDNAFDAEGRWTNGPLRGYMYWLENRDGRFFNKGKIIAGKQALETYGAPGANMADFDGDGDLDIICGEFLDKLTWLENAGSRKKPSFKAGRVLIDENGDTLRMPLQMITPAAVDFDQDGLMDLVVGDEDGRVAFIRNTGKKKNRMPIFKAPVFFKQVADNLKFGALTAPFSVDWDGDGFEDIISGNSSGGIAFIKNRSGGATPSWAEPVPLKANGETIRIMAGTHGSIQGPAEAKWGYTTLTVADWDKDGKNDIVVNSIWGKVVWYKNTGDLYNLEGPYPVKWNEAFEPVSKPEWIWWKPAPDEFVTQWRTTPFAIDWNKDGLQDLVMLDQEGYLSYFERTELDGKMLLQPGQRIFYLEDMAQLDRNNRVTVTNESKPQPIRLNAGTAGASGRRKFCLTDWDGDGDLDLMVNSNNVAWFENVRQKDGRVYFINRGDISDAKLAGHDTSPTPVFWDKSKLPDLLVGAEDGHFYLLKNSHKENKK